ncbi:MAG TPA: hypothetical protein VJX67_15980, partial [Blastocatellia bacterium]|nr:hypothetical protein [Blastocatellia bacterium]
MFRYRSNQPVSLSAHHAVFELSHHLVFATRYRQGVFNNQAGSELVNYWLKVAEKRGFAIDYLARPRSSSSEDRTQADDERNRLITYEQCSTLDGAPLSGTAHTVKVLISSGSR